MNKNWIKIWKYLKFVLKIGAKYVSDSTWKTSKKYSQEYNSNSFLR